MLPAFVSFIVSYRGLWCGVFHVSHARECHGVPRFRSVDGSADIMACIRTGTLGHHLALRIPEPIQCPAVGPRFCLYDPRFSRCVLGKVCFEILPAIYLILDQPLGMRF